MCINNERYLKIYFYVKLYNMIYHNINRYSGVTKTFSDLKNNMGSVHEWDTLRPVWLVIFKCWHTLKSCAEVSSGAFPANYILSSMTRWKRFFQ